MLVGLAILPVFLLGFYIYKKDTHKEPAILLLKLFLLGCLSCVPAVILELIIGNFFPENPTSVIVVFLKYLIEVALVEEACKWFFVKLFGYNSSEFDEVYDIIVYAVFVSLGFAGLENIGYVLTQGSASEGIAVAIVRALISIPGHTYFAIIMGYYLGKAKISSINNNKDLVKKNMTLSIIVPSLIHMAFDSLLTINQVGLLLVMHVSIIIYCIRLINKLSKIQHNLNASIQSNVVKNDGTGHITVDAQRAETLAMQNGQFVHAATPLIDVNAPKAEIKSVTPLLGEVNSASNMNAELKPIEPIIIHPQITVPTEVLENKPAPVAETINYKYCPVCGTKVEGYAFCPSCGLKLK